MLIHIVSERISPCRSLLCHKILEIIVNIIIVDWGKLAVFEVVKYEIVPSLENSPGIFKILSLFSPPVLTVYAKRIACL